MNVLVNLSARIKMDSETSRIVCTWNDYDGTYNNITLSFFSICLSTNEINGNVNNEQ